MPSGPPALLFPKLDIASRTFARLIYVISFWASANLPKYGFPLSPSTRVVFPGKWTSIRWSTVPSGVSTGGITKETDAAVFFALHNLDELWHSFGVSGFLRKGFPGLLFSPPHFRKACLLFRYSDQFSSVWFWEYLRQFLLANLLSSSTSPSQ